jgi:hypothetical protein
MLTDIHPKLPMRDKSVTMNFYLNLMGFKLFGHAGHKGYLMIEKDDIQLHFFEFTGLDPLENYGQIYIRTDDIEHLYKSALEHQVPMPAAGHLEAKPWGQKEFSILDPDHNLITFDQEL